MKRLFCLQKFLVVVCLGMLIFTQATNAFAHDGREMRRVYRGDDFYRKPRVVVVERVYSGHHGGGYRDGRLLLPLFLGLVGVTVGAVAIHQCSK
jgi:hypothetical protein